MMMSFGWFGLIGLVIIIYIILSIPYNKTMNTDKSAIEILDERYLKGEITEEKYLRMKELIK